MYFTYTTKRMNLCLLTEDNTQQVLDFLTRNRDYFKAYETLKSPEYYTYDYQRKNLQLEYKAFIDNNYYRYYAFLNNDSNKIIGTVSISNITPYPYNKGTIGYKFDYEYWNNGYATEAISAIMSNIFNETHIHRLEAFIVPENFSSIRVIEKCGFTYEGKCRKSICVNGKYEDHLLFASIKPDIN